MTPVAFALWFLEFCLEGFGARLAYRKRLWPLFIYLAFRAGADLIDFLIFLHFGANAFYAADLVQRTIQYPLLTVLLFHVCGAVLRSDRATVKFYALYGAFITSLAVMLYHEALQITCQNLLAFEFKANVGLAMVMTAAMLAKRQEADLAAYGLILQVFSEWMLTGILIARHDVAAYYAYPAIGALILWNLAAMRAKKPNELPEFSLSLGVNVEGTAKGVGE